MTLRAEKDSVKTRQPDVRAQTNGTVEATRAGPFGPSAATPIETPARIFRNNSRDAFTLRRLPDIASVSKPNNVCTLPAIRPALADDVSVQIFPFDASNR